MRPRRIDVPVVAGTRVVEAIRAIGKPPSGYSLCRKEFGGPRCD